MTRLPFGFTSAALRRRRPPSTVVFDVETVRGPEECGGWGQADRFGLAIAVSWCAAHGYHSWDEARAGALVDYLSRFERIVGFNVLRFDYAVLSAYQPDLWPRLVPRTLDLLADVHRLLGFRVSLDRLAAATLDAHKSGSGAESLRWWREGARTRVLRYCRDDVRLTRDLYHHGRDRGVIRYPDGEAVRPLRVSWRRPGSASP